MRKSVDMTQGELAALIGVKRGLIADIETGRHSIREELKVPIMNALRAKRLMLGELKLEFRSYEGWDDQADYSYVQMAAR
jgi:DNA-binding XRE family transcriptional regulator